MFLNGPTCHFLASHLPKTCLDLCDIHYLVLLGTVPNETIISVVCDKRMSTSYVNLYAFVSLCIYCNLSMTLYDTNLSGHMRLRASCLKPRNSKLLLITVEWSVVLV